VASVPIPPAFHVGPLYFRMTRPDPNGFVVGFGLLTTNAASEFSDWLGKHVGESHFKMNDLLPRTGVPAWVSYMLGIDSWHPDGLREQAGMPWGGGWPSRSNGVLRFGIRTNLTYVMDQAASLSGPWSPVSNIIPVLDQQGWREITTSNEPSMLYRIRAR
jgi:hypothetical protein